MSDERISIYDQLNRIRMVLLMETEPFSNQYNQIRLNNAEYKKLSDFLHDHIMTPEEGHHCHNPKCSGKVFNTEDRDITLPDIPDKYDEIQTDTPPAN